MAAVNACSKRLEKQETPSDKIGERYHLNHATIV